MKTVKIIGLVVVFFAFIAAAPVMNNTGNSEKNDHMSDTVELAVQSEALSILVAAVQRTALTIKLNNYGVTVNGASVIQADVEAANGIILIIDAVIIPQPADQSSY